MIQAQSPLEGKIDRASIILIEAKINLALITVLCRAYRMPGTDKQIYNRATRQFLLGMAGPMLAKALKRPLQAHSYTEQLPGGRVALHCLPIWPAQSKGAASHEQ